MRTAITGRRTLISKMIVYLALVITGLLIIVLCSVIQQSLPPTKGEYYYSSFLLNNFRLWANILFVITGLVVGYYSTRNPWLAGWCLMGIFPITSVAEAAMYKGSHNLLGIEFIFYFAMALPSVAAVYIGRYLAKRFKMQNENS